VDAPAPKKKGDGGRQKTAQTQSKSSGTGEKLGDIRVPSKERHDAWMLKWGGKGKHLLFDASDHRGLRSFSVKITQNPGGHQERTGKLVG